MKIAVAFLDDDLRLAEVRIAPGLFGRLLRRPERVVCAVAGPGVWIDDVTGCRIRQRRVVDAIERELTRPARPRT
jgi:hypothetical protein